MDKSLVSPTNNINKFLESFLARELFSREFGILALFSNKREKENITRNILSLSLRSISGFDANAESFNRVGDKTKDERWRIRG